MRRGEVWWADIEPPAGSELGYRRPVLILQADFLNRSTLRTVIVASLSTNLRLADLPGNLRLSRRDTGLPKDSVVNLTQVTALDRTQLTECTGRISQSILTLVDDGLRLVLDLS